MSYSAKFEGWKGLKLADLLVAYRKAKADCFFDSNIFPTAIKFAEYESDLLGNLNSLLEELKENKGFSSMDNLLGDFRLIPKKMDIKHDHSKSRGHVHFSDPERSFKNIPNSSRVTPEFRIVGDFPVNTHIISALWINMVGHKFDACLDDKCCYADRLKRIHDEEELCLKGKPKQFNIDSIRSFKSYFQPYQSFRRDGIQAMRNELEKDKNIVGVSLDLKSYYHNLDPMALTLGGLRKSLGLVGNKQLSRDEVQFTRELSILLNQWSVNASNFFQGATTEKEISGGLAIGLTASKIIANVLLHRWDELVQQKLAPIYYGRYVDDMFIVLRDTGNISCIDNLMALFVRGLGQRYLSQDMGESENKVWSIQQGVTIQATSQISFQSEKQKLFVLSGQTGLDLLDSIGEEIRELSSEYRLMPSPGDFENSTAVKVLTAVSGIGDSADNLRRTDGLTLKRLGLALQLRHVETLARILPDSEWKKDRLEFYTFARNHIFSAANLFNNFSYLPRVLGLAVGLGEWKAAMCIVECAFDSLSQLSKYFSGGSNVVLNGSKVILSMEEGRLFFQSLKNHLSWVFFCATLRYITEQDKKSTCGSADRISSFAAKLEGYSDDFCSRFSLTQIPFTYSSPSSHLELDWLSLLNDYSSLLMRSDLSYKAYKETLKHRCERLGSKSRPKSEISILFSEIDEAYTNDGMELGEVLSEACFINLADLIEFRSERNSRCKLTWHNVEMLESESLLPYLFPTRPYTANEVAELIPECIFPGGNTKPYTWLKYLKALRGVRGNVIKEEDDASSDHKELSIGSQTKKSVIIALSNFRTDEQEWMEMADDRSKLRLGRYKRIAELVNQAIKLTPKPDYLVFPELSVPIAWIDAISAKLMSEGISLIAGTEYRHYPPEDQEGKKIISEACLVLSDDRLGFPSWVKIWQPKLKPAVGEEKDLVSKFGRTWASPTEANSEKNKRRIYNHNGLYFGVMICSELQNSKARVAFQGDIDALFVLSWNQDLETFSSLVDSASLDIHAYTILVNNREYGDSRVRSPAKQSFKRDIARVRGGDNDFIVSVTLDIESLRAFQSRSKRWPEITDEFKPVPEGYKISDKRKTLPSIK